MSFDNFRGVSPIRTNVSLYKEPESDMCKRCAKYIYPLEMMGPVMGFKYHKMCFRCHACERLLDFKNYRTNLIDLNDRELYCTAHTPRHGKYGDNFYAYNAISKSPGNYEVNEYSAEYYKMHHKSSDNLDSISKKLEPYGYGNIPADFSHIPPVGTNSNYEVGWKSHLEQESKMKISKSSEQLIKESTSSTSISTSKIETHMVAVESHSSHQEIKSSSSSSGLNSSASPSLYNNQEALQHHHHSSSTSSAGGLSGGGVNIQVLPSSNLNIDGSRIGSAGSSSSNATATFYANENNEKSKEHLRNIIVDVIAHNDEEDRDANNRYSGIGGGAGAGGYKNQYETSSYYINQTNQNRNDKNNSSSDVLISSVGSSGIGTKNDDQDNIHNLKTIYAEALNTNKLRTDSSSSAGSSSNLNTAPTTTRPISNTTNFYTNSQTYNTTDEYQKDSNLKNIYAEASMSQEFRDIPSGSNDYRRSLSSESSSGVNSNLKNIILEAITHNQAASTSSDKLYRQSSGDKLLDKNSYSDAVFNATNNHSNSSHNLQSTTMNSHLYESEQQKNKSNSNLVATDAADLSDPNLKNIYAQAFISNSATQNLVQNNQQVNIQQFSNVKEVYSETLMHHHHYHESSSTSGGRSGFGGSSIDIPSRQQHHVSAGQITNIPIENVITPSTPTSPGGPYSNLKMIMSDVMATNGQNANISSNTNIGSGGVGYVYNPNKYNYTGPNSNLKKIVAEANDYNNSINPNQYLNIKDLRPIEMDMADVNQNNIIGENKGFGLLRLTVHYDQLRSRLSITVHEARYLRNLDKKTVSDPYARVYLVPDGKPSYKRKTTIIKNNLNPIWQQTFDYPITLNESLAKTLTVNLKDERGFFEKQETQFLGEVVIPLKSVVNLTTPFTKWYFLQPLNSNSNILLNTGTGISSF